MRTRTCLGSVWPCTLGWKGLGRRLDAVLGIMKNLQTVLGCGVDAEGGVSEAGECVHLEVGEQERHFLHRTCMLQRLGPSVDDRRQGG